MKTRKVVSQKMMIMKTKTLMNLLIMKETKNKKSKTFKEEKKRVTKMM